MNIFLKLQKTYPDGEIKISIENPIKISNKTKMSLVNHSSQQNVRAIKKSKFLLFDGIFCPCLSVLSLQRVI